MTFRLFDALPASVVAAWLAERDRIIARAAAMGRKLSWVERDRLDQLHANRIEDHLDLGTGACFMRNAQVADLVATALNYFDWSRYDLYAWCVMPNHAHAVLRPLPGFELSGILHSWKSFTSTAANRLLNRAGEFWQAESYDHLVRDAEDFGNQVRYVLDNPAKAGLVNWKWVGVRTSLQPQAGP